MAMASLPIELFGLISCHVQDRSTLYSLLLTSRAFNYDAEKTLYRDVSLGIAKQNLSKIRMLATHLASCKRVAALVQSITINPHEFSIERIRNVLRVTCNLTSLSILYAYWSQADRLLSDLTNGTSFRLLSLDINCYRQRDFKDFIHSQSQLSSISWLPPDSHDFPPISDLSNITTLESTPEFLQYIIPHCQLRRLRLASYSILTTPIHSLEVFSVNYQHSAAELATLLPNLRYLEVCVPNKMLLKRYLNLPPRIEALRILISVELGISSQTLFDHAQRLFENNLTLRYVEIGYQSEPLPQVDGVKVRLLGEGKEKRSETFHLDAWDFTEWMRW